ncbi:diacylglycerol kinase family protein [Aerococcaceae bacterium DSM 111021]|nr:diacylglycerol kinase family protein [Aerococcaceae bacterium DSM 111021]
MAFHEGNSNFIESVYHALQGVIETVKVEKNIKTHLVITAFVIIAGFLFNISLVEWLSIVICIGLVLGMELLNTSIEHTVDLASQMQYHNLAKKAKDASAGAVLIVAIMSVVIGMIIFIPKIWKILYID